MSGLEDPTSQEPELAHLETVPQKHFPSDVKVHGGLKYVSTHKGAGSAELIAYSGGDIVLGNDSSIMYSGFGLKKPIHIATPDDLRHFANFSHNYSEYSKVHPTPNTSFDHSVWDRQDQATAEDFVNLSFYGGARIDYQVASNASLQGLLSSEDERDKLLIASAFSSYPRDIDHASCIPTLIRQRPELTTELLKFVCREFVQNGGHSKFKCVIPYLIDHPEVSNIFPETHKPALANLLLSRLSSQVFDLKFSESMSITEKIKRIEEIEKECPTFCAKLGLNMEQYGLSDSMSRIFHCLKVFRKMRTLP